MARPKDTAEQTVWAQTGEKTYGVVHPPLDGPLPPGLYSIYTTMMGDARFCLEDTNTESLLRFKKYADTVLAEIDFFWTRRQVYETTGLQYRRGILLYGPPGTGKSSLIRVILKDVIAKGGMGFLIDRGVGSFSTCYSTFRKMQPDTPLVVVIEDIERIIDYGNESELLDILDGQRAGVTNTIFLATTNYIQKLPDRLKNRPSRFDRRIEISAPVDDIRRNYFESLFKTIPAGLPVFPEALRSQDFMADTVGFSLAHIKELFTAVVLLGANYTETILALREMQPEPERDDDDDDE